MSFSPGIRSDHPAFGFAMWENTPASGMFQGGHYPSGPSAMPVGTPAKPLLDLIQGRNRVDGAGVQRGTTPQQNGGADGGGGSATPPDPLAELEQWAKSNGLSAQTLEVLKNAGCESVQGLRYLQCGDLDRLNLPIIQHRVLQNALGLSQPVTQPPQPAGPGGGTTAGLPPSMPGLGIGVHPGIAQQAAPPMPELDRRPSGAYAMHLDRQNGKPDYYSIVDHLPGSVGLFHESKVAGGNGEPELFLRSGLQRKLARVTPHEWNCANVMILDKLLKKGALGSHRGLREYLNYTFVINELAGRYTWESVLKYDDEYRQLQAVYGFPWGDQVDHLSKVFLKEKPANPPTPSGGKQYCGLYNTEGKECHWKRCKYTHACSLCGKAHPRYQHNATGYAKGTTAKASESENQ